MTKTTKVLLALAVIGLAVGLMFVTNVVNVQNAVALYITLPAGAIFFGLFLLSKMLEKEAALFDEEHQLLEPEVRPTKNIAKAELVGKRQHQIA